MLGEGLMSGKVRCSVVWSGVGKGEAVRERDGSCDSGVLAAS